jgi:transcription elongation factor GreA-like protein
MIYFEFTPGDYVINTLHKDWGIGQVQSIIKNKITVNFQNQGKQVINGEVVMLEKFKNEQK